MVSLINGLGGTAGFGENSLDPNDDDSTALINIRSVFASGLNFLGKTYTGFYLNNNGNITFETPLDAYTPSAINDNTANPIIAPFFADIDTRFGSVIPSVGGTSTGSNLLYWDLDPLNHQITITWDDVGKYAVGTVPNAFQLILKDTGSGNFGIEFRYESINWVVGTATNNSPARAGYSAGNGTNYFELAQSGTSAMLDLESASNVNNPGVYNFFVSNGVVNQQPNNINLSATAVNENSAINTVVGLLTTIDPDLTNTHTYSLVDNAGERFKIVGNKLQIASKSILNFEANSSHIISVKTIDNRGASYLKNFTISLKNVDEAPTVSNINKSGDEDTSIAFSIGDFTAAFADIDAGNSLAKIKILSLPSKGILKFNGVAIALNQEILITQLNQIVFTPEANFYGMVNFKWKGSDGSLYAIASAQINLTINQIIDTIQSAGSYTLTPYLENLTLIGTSAINGTGNAMNNTIIGNTGNNTLNGGLGNDTMNGGEGNDYLNGSLGNDTMNGGIGNDIYIVDNLGDFVLETSTPATEIDTIYAAVNYGLVINVERLILIGTGNINGTGNALDNIIHGNSSDNILSGGGGNDILRGDVGADRFKFSNLTSGIDRILDFNSTLQGDKIVLSALGYGGGLLAGTAISAAQFLTVTAGSATTTTSQRLIYNSMTGGLFFDADGSGSAVGAVQFATLGLSTHPSLAAGDFSVI